MIMNDYNFLVTNSLFVNTFAYTVFNFAIVYLHKLQKVFKKTTLCLFFCTILRMKLFCGAFDNHQIDAAAA